MAKKNTKGAQKKAQRKAAAAAQAEADRVLKAQVLAAESAPNWLEGLEALARLKGVRIVVPAERPEESAAEEEEEEENNGAEMGGNGEPESTSTAEAPEPEQPPAACTSSCCGGGAVKGEEKEQSFSIRYFTQPEQGRRQEESDGDAAAGAVGEALSAADLQFAFDLTKANMQEVYEATWGWSDKRKMEELTDAKSRFLVCYESEPAGDGAAEEKLGKPVAFVMMYFNAEEEPESAAVTARRGPRVQADRFSVYCMEIQVLGGYQGYGIGRRLMQLMELIGAKAGCEVSLLTVLKPNVGARRFYTEKLKYQIDISSPEHVDPDNVSQYEFVCLGKTLPKRK